MSRILLLLSIAVLAACGGTATQSGKALHTASPVAEKVVEPAVIVPIFNADSAYDFIAKQVAFGPRVPNTAPHRKCGEYLVAKLKEYGADVVTQDVGLKAYTGEVLKSRNIIAQFNPAATSRVMLCAHWDTRPWADTDPDKGNHYKPYPGANDGGSGVGVLLEIARHLSQVPATVGVDIILFDAEDYGLHENDSRLWSKHRHSWALGSQYWSIHPHRQGYDARYGILLDIVGAPSSTFLREGYSEHFASAVIDKVWSQAAKLGYAQYFVNEEGGAVTDDHYYVNSVLGIPCIDIINHDSDSPNGFGPYHHTMKDDMDWIGRSTLKAVGQTVMTVIYNEK